jgi:hypothetical protein
MKCALPPLKVTDAASRILCDSPRTVNFLHAAGFRRVRQRSVGMLVNFSIGYTSRNIFIMSFGKNGDVAADGFIFFRTIQAWMRFQPSAPVGQPSCLVHSPFSVVYQ